MPKGVVVPLRVLLDYAVLNSVTAEPGTTTVERAVRLGLAQVGVVLPFLVEGVCAVRNSDIVGREMTTARRGANLDLAIQTGCAVQLFFVLEGNAALNMDIAEQAQTIAEPVANQRAGVEAPPEAAALLAAALPPGAPALGPTVQ